MKKLLNSLFKVDLQMKSTPISTLLLMGLFSPNIALAQVQNSSLRLDVYLPSIGHLRF